MGSNRRQLDMKIGDTFGSLTIVAGPERRAFYKQTSTGWICRCDCGRETWVDESSLRRGVRTRCGRNHPPICRTPEYTVWCGMKARCSNPKERSWPRYGGRGIDICAGWKHNFRAFLDDMGARPRGCSIDRIDNDGGYWCGKCEECASLGRTLNCRWASSRQQQRNRSDRRVLEFRGELVNRSDLAERFGISGKLLGLRLHYGWPLERALTEPVNEQYATRRKASR